MDTFSELGKAKAAKGEGWAPPFISCAEDTVGLPLRLLGYGKPLPSNFYFNKLLTVDIVHTMFCATITS